MRLTLAFVVVGSACAFSFNSKNRNRKATFVPIKTVPKRTSKNTLPEIDKKVTGAVGSAFASIVGIKVLGSFGSSKPTPALEAPAALPTEPVFAVAETTPELTQATPELTQVTPDLKELATVVVGSEKPADMDAIKSTVVAMQSNYQSLLASIEDSPRAPGTAKPLSSFLTDLDWNGASTKLSSSTKSIADSVSKVDLSKVSSATTDITSQLSTSTDKVKESLAPIASSAELVKDKLSLVTSTNYGEVINNMNQDEKSILFVAGATVLMIIGSVINNNRLGNEMPDEVRPAQDEKSLIKQVKELSSVVTKLSNELTTVKTKSADTEGELLELKKEATTMRKQVTQAEKREQILQTKLEKAQEKLATETELLKKQLAKVKSSSITATPAVAKKAQRELETNLKNVEKFQAEKEDMEAKLTELAQPTPPATPPATPEVSQGEAFFAEKEELPVAVEAKPAPKKKKATKKKAAPKKTISSNDWSGLSESTLKRKTVKALVDYLEAKGVKVDDGMKKADLVDAVKSA